MITADKMKEIATVMARENKAFKTQKDLEKVLSQIKERAYEGSFSIHYESINKNIIEKLISLGFKVEQRGPYLVREYMNPYVVSWE